ncbi:hypothetical protein OG470_30630 [Micromonospora sp. NBC_00389]|uniref:hypothetical protein n=1 Tax=Micromonospora sp. NBC_00389 TaxID=2903586 RepID=UPI002E202D93
MEDANSRLDGPEPFSVVYCGTTEQPETSARYRRVLEQAGYQVDADPLGENMLLRARLVLVGLRAPVGIPP